MNWGAITQALESYLSGLNLGLPLAWDNVEYKSVAGNPYMRVKNFPVDTEPLTIGPHGVMETVGMFVVELHYPAGEGSGAALSMADTLSAFFLPGISVPAGSGSVTFMKVTIGNRLPATTPDWWVVPVMAHYNAFHNF